MGIIFFWGESSRRAGEIIGLLSINENDYSSILKWFQKQDDGNVIVDHDEINLAGYKCFRNIISVNYIQDNQEEEYLVFKYILINNDKGIIIHFFQLNENNRDEKLYKQILNTLILYNMNELPNKSDFLYVQ
jgi:hypothetical protein